MYFVVLVCDGARYESEFHSKSPAVLCCLVFYCIYAEKWNRVWHSWLIFFIVMNSLA